MCLKFFIAKTNCRPVRILPIVSKIFEKIMSNQLSTYFEKILSESQCGFRKAFSTQHCLLLLFEKWKHAVHNKKAFGALLTDLSKAFKCICRDLLIAKLNAYGLSLPALKLVHNYLQNCKQRTKKSHKDRSWIHSCLTYLSAIYFQLLKATTSQIMLMIPLLM